MQQQEYSLVVKRLRRFERRARWLWLERVVTLGLVAQLLLSGPVGVSLRDKARLEAQKAAEKARLALAESAGVARHALVVRPALDPQMVLEDQREAALDAMPMPSAGLSPVPAPATTARVTRPRFKQQAAFLAEQRPISGPPTASQTAPQGTVTRAAPLTAFQKAEAFSAGVSDAERQMARAAERSARPVASLMESSAAVATPAASGAGTAALGFPMPGELAAPQTLWRAMGAARRHQTISAGRDPFNFAGPFATQPDHLARLQPGPALPSSQVQPIVSGPAPAVSSSVLQSHDAVAPGTPPAVTTPAPPPITLKALGYALSADGNAQAVLSGGNTLYVVNEGEEFADRFRVTTTRPEYLEVEDELTNQIIRLPLGD